MKRFLTVLTVGCLAGAAWADIDIEFGNDATPVSGVGSGGTVDVGAVLAQLIWTPNVPVAQAGVNATLGSGEFLLKDFLAPAGNFGTFADGVSTYLNTDVGGNNVNNGYFFMRMFDDSAKALNDWYLQFQLAGPTLTEYNTVPRPTQYITANLLPGGQAYDLNDATYGNQVIPEPAVASLIVIFGGGLMVGRRIFIKA